MTHNHYGAVFQSRLCYRKHKNYLVIVIYGLIVHRVGNSARKSQRNNLDMVSQNHCPNVRCRKDVTTRRDSAEYMLCPYMLCLVTLKPGTRKAWDQAIE